MSRGARGTAPALMLALLAAAAVAAIVAERAPGAASFTVNNTGTARDARPGDGVCETSTGVCTLRAAIHETNALAGADSIQVPAGTYPISLPATEPNDIRAGDLDIRGGLTVTGAGSGATVITGARRDRVFEVNTPSAVTINDVSIRDGTHAQVGGGILNSGAGSVTVARSLILANKAAKFGGGVANEAGGSVRLLGGTRLSGNSADEAGSAVANLSRGAVEITGAKITSNSSTLGGAAISNMGISPNQGTVSLVQATVTGNVAGSGAIAGGGISNAGDGRVSVDRSTISKNSTGDAGGGIANSGGGTVEVINAKVVGNKTEAGGAGLANAGLGTLTVSSSTIAGNVAQDAGGGILNEAKGGLTVTGSTFSGNSALDGGGISTDGDGGATVTDTQFTANTATQNGGGLNSNGTTGGALTVERVTFSRNRAAADGGGLILEGGAATVLDSDFDANSALSGGGLANHTGGVVDVGRARFTGNTARERGGGVENTADGVVTLTDSEISGNTARERGGGLDNATDAVVKVTHSEVSGNEAPLGGGLTSNSDGSFTVENSTVSGNVASVEGGGVLVLDPVTLIHTTIANNSAPVGGGLQKIGDSRLFLTNTIVANNPGGNCGYEFGTLPIESGGGNLDSGTTCGLLDPTDISGIDPLLGALQNNGGRTRTHAPDPASLAVDLAVSSACAATDQRGIARPQNAGCDIGAHEFEGVVPPPSCAQRGTHTLSATADTWVNQADAGKNFGSDQVLKVLSGASGNARALVRFALPTLPSGCQVVAATLRLTTGAGTVDRVLAVARLGSDWTEAGVTWANQPSTNGEVAAVPSATGTVQWPVVPQVREMYSSGVNHGFGINDALEDDAVGVEQPFNSREAGTDPPQLAITFG